MALSLHLRADPNTLAQRFLSLRTSRDIAALLEIDYSHLTYLIYRSHPSWRYRTFEIQKRSGGTRTINAPNNSLRVLQSKLHEVLKRVYRRKTPVHGFAVGRDIVSNATPHTKKRFVLNLDLQDFFPSINFGRVRGMFMGIPYRLPGEAATVLAQICCFENHLPQGAPTSPIISNMICAKLDSDLWTLASEFQCFYTRFADDITFSTTRRRFPAALAVLQREQRPISVYTGDRLRTAIEANGFKINPRKVTLRGPYSHQEVTGLTVNQFPNVRRRFIRQLRAMIHALRKHGLDKAQAEYAAKYRPTDRRTFKSRGRYLDILRGKLNFIRMVRGETDSMFHSYQIKLAIADPTYRAILDKARPTGWQRIERDLKAISVNLLTASEPIQCMGIGLHCRELLRTLAQTVYDPARHLPKKGKAPSSADTVGMLEAYFNVELQGKSGKSARQHAKTTVNLADTLTHDRNATPGEAQRCLRSTEAAVDLVMSLAGRKPKPSPKNLFVKTGGVPNSPA